MKSVVSFPINKIQCGFWDYFNIIQDDAHNIAKNKGFHDILSQLKKKIQTSVEIPKSECCNGQLTEDEFKSIEDLFVIKSLGLICEEIGEAMSAWRNHNAFDDKLTNRRGVEVEMADAVIRIMDLAGYLKLDIAGAIIEKMEFNNGRPYMHGKIA